tara:strand:- start:870 stop:1535 length:666 start_codon:yes stop_codon:yes gene_type:complete
MKKLLLSVVFSVLYVTSASAELGVNVGFSGNAGLFAASAHEKHTNTNGKTNAGTEHGSAGWGSIFIEKTLGDVLLVGIDYVPEALETDTTETAKSDKRTAASDAISASTNKIQIDFENLTTMYVGARLGESFYAKAGVMTVDVITNENLGTGGSYGDADLDGSMFGVGYNHTTDNGAFIRVEGNYMSFDGVTKTNSDDSEKQIKLKNLDGVSGKISIGKSF